MIKLPDVTLCAVSAHLELTVRAMNICQQHIEFGDIVLVTPNDFEDFLTLELGIPYLGSTRVEKIDKSVFGDSNTIGWYDKFCSFHMHKYINTSHVLIVQSDGYIINPNAWSNDFLNYDYIGARWPWIAPDQSVGNGGFCLRSKRLLQEASILKHEGDHQPDDVLLSRVFRKQLEERGLVFAPEDVADRFSYERVRPVPPNTFGFHGLYNMGRHVTDKEMLELIPLFPDYVTKRPDYHELALTYSAYGKHEMSQAIRSRM